MKIPVLEDKCYNGAVMVTSGNITPTASGVLSSEVSTKISFSAKEYGVDKHLPCNFMAISSKQQNEFLNMNRDNRGAWLSSKAEELSRRI